MTNRHSALTIYHFPFSTPRPRRGQRGSAMIETTILLPVYMIIIYAIIYFGYATLSMQKQHQASAYTALLPQNPSSETIKSKFFPWAESMGIEPESTRTTHWNDLHYQEDPQTVLPELLYACHHLSGGEGSGYVFDQERIGVSLSIMAMPKITRSITLSTIIGGEVTESLSWTSAAQYLNSSFEGRPALAGGGFIDAPATFEDQHTGWNPEVGKDDGGGVIHFVSRALTGIPPDHQYNSDQDYADNSSRWLRRRRVTSSLSIDVPWAGVVVASPDETGQSFTQFATLDYDAPAAPLTTGTRAEITRRGECVRLSPADAGPGAPSVGQLLQNAGHVLGSDAPADPAQMDHDLETILGEGIWKRPE